MWVQKLKFKFRSVYLEFRHHSLPDNIKFGPFGDCPGLEVESCCVPKIPGVIDPLLIPFENFKEESQSVDGRGGHSWQRLKGGLSHCLSTPTRLTRGKVTSHTISSVLKSCPSVESIVIRFGERISFMVDKGESQEFFGIWKFLVDTKNSDQIRSRRLSQWPCDGLRPAKCQA